MPEKGEFEAHPRSCALAWGDYTGEQVSGRQPTGRSTGDKGRDGKMGKRHGRDGPVGRK